MDKKFQKQLDKFGTESTRIVDVPIHQQRREKLIESNGNVIKSMMDSIEGREWLYNKLDFYCVFSTPFVPNSPETTAFLCGLQEAGHQLQNEIMKFASDKYFQMITEATARSLNNTN